MNIFKAFLLTALTMGLEVLISFVVYKFIEPKVSESLSSDYLIHYFGITGRIPMVISYFLVFYLSFKTIFDWKKGIEKVNNINLKTVFFLITIAIGLEFFDRPLFDFCKIFDHFNGIELEPYEFSKSSNLSIFYSVVSFLIIAPIFEELFFRKFLFAELLKKHSLTMSIFVSSICFSLIHLPSYRNLLPTFILGIISCLIYKNTKNIFYTIILHFLTNLSWLLLVSYGKTYYEWSYGLEYNLVYWLLFILGAGLSYFGINKIIEFNNR